MYITIIIVLIITGLTNMIADVLIVSGKDYNNPKQTLQERVNATPEKHLLMSGAIGLLSIMFWITPIYSLSKLDSIAGTIALISFAMYVLNIAVYHVMVAYTGLIFKANPSLEKEISKYISIYSGVCIVTSLIYTITMIYLGQIGVLNMNILHYLTLPVPAIIFGQYIFGRLLKRVPHYTSVAGTLSMMLSFISTMHIMMINQI